MVEQKVTYTLEINGKFIIIENVPARVPSEPKKPGFLRLLWAVTKYKCKKTRFLATRASVLLKLIGINA
jgi:hypothetical protein